MEQVTVKEMKLLHCYITDQYYKCNTQLLVNFQLD